jgi:hypothetical protein
MSDALIERVYEDVYLSRWNPKWEQMLHQPDKSLNFRMKNPLSIKPGGSGARAPCNFGSIDYHAIVGGRNSANRSS